MLFRCQSKQLDIHVNLPSQSGHGVPGRPIHVSVREVIVQKYVQSCTIKRVRRKVKENSRFKKDGKSKRLRIVRVKLGSSRCDL